MTSLRPMALFLALANMSLAVGCGDDRGDDDDDDVGADGDADADADADGDADADADADADGDADPNEPNITIRILDEVIHAGDTITVALDVANFDLEQPDGPNQEGHGHYHIYLDGDTGGDYLLFGTVPETEVDLPGNLSLGPHSLRANLTDNHHVPFNPEIEDTADFTVE